jgi:hypothetical protein
MNRLRKMFVRLKQGLLMALFLLIPVAGAFHPRMKKRENPDEKEIGTEK